MLDQLRAIDNRRFTNCIGILPAALTKIVQENLKNILDLQY